MPPGTRNALVPPSPNYLRDAGQFVGGVGKGLSNQFVTGPLELVQQSYYDPYALGQGVVQGVAQFAQDPVGAVGNSLRSMWNRAKSSPAGLGEVVGENIDPRNWLKPRKAMRQELDVYHGTPHTFDPEEGAPLGRFRSSKIGTGEGKQMYGYGLYFSEHPGVATSYKIGLTNPALHFTQELEDVLPSTLKGKAADWADEIQSGKTFRDLVATVRYPWQKTLLQQQKAPIENLIKRQQTGGSLYKVDLPDAKIEQMLDWDKPLTEQPQLLDALKRSKNKAVQSVMAQIGDTSKPIMSFGQDLGLEDGQGLMRRLSYALDGRPNSPKASTLLQKLGVPGVKYLDASSRDGGKGTRNFVVFPSEEQHLNILSRD